MTGQSDARGYTGARDPHARKVFAELTAELRAKRLAERHSRLHAQRERDRAATRELERTGMTCPECESRVIVSIGRVVCTNYGGCELSCG